MLSKNVHKISCLQYELVLDLGQMVGQLISKLEEKLWDIDIKNFTVSPIDQIRCIRIKVFRVLVEPSLLGLAAGTVVLIIAGELFLLGEVGEAVVERLLALQGEVQLVEERRPATLLLALEALGHVRVLAPTVEAVFIRNR